MALIIARVAIGRTRQGTSSESGDELWASVVRLTAQVAELERKVAALQRGAGATGRPAAASEPVNIPPTPVPFPSIAVSPTPSPVTVHADVPRAMPAVPGESAPSDTGAPLSTRPTPPVVPRTPPPWRDAEKKPEINLETQIGGRWANRIGIVLLIFGVSFFLKLAFDNNWIGPKTRIAIGIVAGIALLPWSQRLRTKGYTYFAEGIAGLGAGTLYLCVWAGWHYYALFSHGGAFLGMSAVTATLAMMSLRNDSQRMAYLSMLGGFLTPILLSTGVNSERALFTYLAVLNVGLAVMAVRKEWQWVAGPSLGVTQLYFWAWYLTYYEESARGLTIGFLTLFFVLYAAVPPMRVRIWRKALDEDYLLLFQNGLCYFGALLSILWNSERNGLTFLTLGLAAVHLGFGRVVRRGEGEEGPGELGTVYLGLAIFFASAAIPIKLSGNWIAIAFAIEAATLAWAGWQRKRTLLRGYGYAFFAAATARILAWPPHGGSLFLNERFLTCAMLVGSICVALHAKRRFRENGEDWDNAVMAMLGVLVNLYALAALSLEVDQQVTGQYTEGLWLLGLWSAYAAALFLAGGRFGLDGLRVQGLVLFGIAFAETFLLPLLTGSGAKLQAFFNGRFAAYLILVGALAVVLWCGQRFKEKLSHAERTIVAIFSVVIHFYAIGALSVELWDFFGAGPGRRATQVWSSIWR